MLCRDKKAIRLTDDHKPDRVDELTRIEELGGKKSGSIFQDLIFKKLQKVRLFSEEIASVFLEIWL